MHPNHAPFFSFRDALHAAAPLTEAHRIFVLQRELDRARNRAWRLERHGRGVERELVQVRRELARSKAEAREQLHAMRLEVLAMDAQCQELDEVCRALLLTIEHAACSELAEAPLVAGVSP
jgi:hypothetical protein